MVAYFVLSVVMEPVFAFENHELNLRQPLDSAPSGVDSNDRIDRRKRGLARSAYAGILVAVASFTCAVALVAIPATDSAAAPIVSQIPTEQLGLIEAPTINPPIAEAPELGSGAAVPRLLTERLAPVSAPPKTAGVEPASPIEPDAATAAPAEPSVSPTPMATTVPASSGTEAEQRGQAALSLIAYPWAEKLPGWEISFHPPKTGLYGLTLVSEKRIEIYLRDGEPQSLLAHVLAHEIGHAVDVTLNDGPDRRVWSDARDIESAQWWPGDGATDFATGAGDFAESFAAWQVGDEHFRSKIAGPPTAEQIQIVKALAG